MERLLGNHMEQLDIEGLTSALHESREDAVARNAREGEYIEKQASRTTGIGPLIASFFASKNELPKDGVPESRFYMWRTIFAMAHADDEVTKDELDFMYDVLESEPFSKEQRRILEDDINDPQDIGDAFMKIADQEDRSRFFYYARMLCWSDGNFDEQEQAIILKLRSLHARNVDFDRVLETVDMQLDDKHKSMLAEDMKEGHALANFFKRFKS